MQSLIMLLVVIYLRVSTEDQAKKGFSLPEQREACLRKAQDLARQLEAGGQQVELQTREFMDDFGGDIAERPVLEAVRTFCREQRPQYFICMDPDRFSRSLKWQLILADEFEGQGARLVFVQQEYDSADAMSKAFFQFRGLMSEIEKAKILERTSRGIRGKIKAGGRPNGACPFGYRHNKETDRLEIYEPEAEWLRRMFEWVAEEQIGITIVAHRLNSAGVPRKRSAGKWYRSVIGEILRNTSYYGEMRCQRRDHRGIAAVRRLPREKRRTLSAKRRPESEWRIVPIPAIITKELFTRANANLGNSRRGGCRNTALLSMLVRCGVCGGNMSYTRGSNGIYHIRCPKRNAHNQDYKPGTPRCPSRHHRGERVEAQVWEMVTTWLTDPAILEEYLDSRHDNSNLVRQIGRASWRERV